MKIALIAVIAVLIITVATVAAIGATGGFKGEPTPTPTPTPTSTPTATPTISKPSVGFMPGGWSPSDEIPYDGPQAYGTISYGNIDQTGVLFITYGDIPSQLQGSENDQDALIAWASEFNISGQEETRTMTVSGQLAGYSKVYDQGSGWYWIQLVFIKGDTYVGIYGHYKATSEDEADVMSLIDSISF